MSNGKGATTVVGVCNCLDGPGAPFGSPCPRAQAAMQTIPALTLDDAHPSRLTGPAAGTTSWLLGFRNAPKCVDALARFLYAGGAKRDLSLFGYWRAVHQLRYIQNMGIETIPVVEGYEITTFFLVDEWKWLTDCFNDDINAIAQELNTTPLTRFCSYSREDAILGLSEEEVEDEEEDAELKDGVCYKDGYAMWSQERQWFEPKEALRTTGALIQFLRLHPERLDNDAEDVECFVGILETLQGVLSRAEVENKRFYLKSFV
jgi:hypothetical protein